MYTVSCHGNNPQQGHSKDEIDHITCTCMWSISYMFVD